MSLPKGSNEAHNVALRAWETRRRNGNIIPWNKDKKGCQVSWCKGLTKETSLGLQKTSQKLTGRSTWNWGLTKETDERVYKNVESRIGLKFKWSDEAKLAANVRRIKALPFSKEELCSLYWDKQLSVSEISKLKGIDVTNWMIKFNIPRRTTQEAMKLYSLRHPSPEGSSHLQWKEKLGKRGEYISVHLFPDSPFYPMTQKHTTPQGWGIVSEHRLVMAQHLCRCLEKWEIIHHVNGIKDDNRIENLEIYPNEQSHLSVGLMKRMLEDQKKEIRLLKCQVKILAERLNQVGRSVDEEETSKI